MKRDDFLLEFEEYIKDKNIESEEDLKMHFEAFTATQDFKNKMLNYEPIYEDEAEDVYDYLELAESASSSKEALKYAKKALQLDPENWDAASMVSEISAKTPESLLEKLEKIIAQANMVMERDGWFSEEYIGSFWGFHETRPYMRLRNTYLNVLTDCSMFKKAIQECEDMIRLNENDNLGIRFRLMHLYAYFEDEQTALELHKKFIEDEGSMMLLPLSMLYYKKGDFKKSAKYLRIIKNNNKDTLKFFKAFINHELADIFDDISPYGYQPYTIQEFAVEMEENRFLFVIMDTYFDWGLKKLKSMK